MIHTQDSAVESLGSRWPTSESDFPQSALCVFVAELLRENKRMLDRSIRDIERERMQLQTQEKKLIAEIKKTAKQGQMVHSLYLSV